jgi:hypothetical protein
VIGFNRNAWSDSAETGGRIQPKRVIAFTRNPQTALGGTDRTCWAKQTSGRSQLAISAAGLAKYTEVNGLIAA